MSRRLRVLLACECSGRVRDEFARRNWEAWSADILPSETPVQGTFHANSSSVPRIHGPERLGLKNNFHYQGDVRDLFSDTHPVNAQRLAAWETTPGMAGLWDLIIAFPPCDHLSLAGARWFKEKRADGRQQAGADFFMEMINAPSPHVAVENPRNIMFRQYRKPDQIVQPWEFGDPFRKNTCLWLKGLPKLTPDYTEPEVLATTVSGDMKGYRLHRATTGGGSSRTDKAAGVVRSSYDFNGRQHYEDSEGRKNRAKVRSRTFPGIAAAMASQFGAYVERQQWGGSYIENSGGTMSRELDQHRAELAADIAATPTVELLAAYREAGCSEYNLREFLKDGPKQKERFRAQEAFRQANEGLYPPCGSCGGTIYARVGRSQCFGCY